MELKTGTSSDTVMKLMRETNITINITNTTTNIRRLTVLIAVPRDPEAINL